jgi:hypothetical protein
MPTPLQAAKQLEVLHRDGGFTRGSRTPSCVQARAPRAQHLIKGDTARTDVKSRVFIASGVAQYLLYP